MIREDGVGSYVGNADGKLDREMIATILENYGYNSHARRWHMSPLEAAAPELMEAVNALLQLDIRDNGEYIADAVIDMANAALAKALGE
jgi:hypothetical protein